MAESHGQQQEVGPQLLVQPSVSKPDLSVDGRWGQATLVLGASGSPISRGRYIPPGAEVIGAL